MKQQVSKQHKALMVSVVATYDAFQATLELPRVTEARVDAAIERWEQAKAALDAFEAELVVDVLDYPDSAERDMQVLIAYADGGVVGGAL